MARTQTNLANKYTFHSLLTNPLRLILFIRDLYSHQKIEEFFSFFVWELFHKLKIFNEKDYLVFAKQYANIDCSNTLSQDLCKSSKALLFFETEVKVEKILERWKNVFVFTDESSGKKTYWGNIESQPTKLYKQDRESTKYLTLIQEFENEITCIFISNKNTIFVCTKGTIYCSNNNGGNFQRSLELSNANSYILPSIGITETPLETIIIGEYGSIWDYKKQKWLKIPYLYYTNDRGVSWKKLDFLFRGGNKHVHIIRYCKYLDRLILTDGDNKKKLWISDSILTKDLDKVSWNLFNKFHIQMGGHTSILEEDRKIFFGTDYLGGTNFILETNDFKKVKRQIVPDPYRRSIIESMSKIITVNTEQIWVSIKSSVRGSKCLVMYTTNSGKTWNRYLEYDGSLHIFTFCCSSNKEIAETYFNFTDLKYGITNTYKISI